MGCDRYATQERQGKESASARKAGSPAGFRPCEVGLLHVGLSLLVLMLGFNDPKSHKVQESLGKATIGVFLGW
ncbi:hypothetical protein AA0229_1520 [Gluconobacter cerinus NRIC 0229]|uniref:Uncharacterized protein n=1 Tax=Gluconobacter cerinus TaxID=38307 RepID=A0AAV5NIJ2_9PROT|nr:hypothetical protein AA0229_1520 [Gluconobacter cerinus NRIC 0229]GLQ63759.1 hypothetical protein GCM10007867_26040 [Gluconobacter cerinus]